MTDAWFGSLQVGDKITVWIDQSVVTQDLQKWCAGIILEIKSSKIKIRLIHLVDELEEESELWIDGKSDKIDRNPSRMHYDILPNILQSCSPSDMISHKNQIIVLMAEGDGMDPGLYAYHLVDGTFNRISEFPNSFDTVYMAMAMNKETDELYIIDLQLVLNSSASTPSTGYCATYDLHSNEWKSVDEIPVLAPEDLNEGDLSCVYMPKPIDALCFFSWGGLQWKVRKNRLNWKNSKLDKHREIESRNPLWTYDEGRRHIIVCIHDSNLYHWDLDKDDTWRRLELTLPLPYSPAAFLGFGCILFVLYLNRSRSFQGPKESTEQSEIWCLELNSNRWFKSQKSLPSELTRFYRMVKTDDNYLHFINPGYGRYHVRMNLRDMIPKQLLNFYDNLVNGFIAICLNGDRKKAPMELKQMILFFYSSVFS